MAVDPTYFKLPTESVDDYNKRIAASHPDLPAPGATSVTGVTNTAVAPNQNGSLQGTLTTPPPATTPAPTTSAPSGMSITSPATSSGGFQALLGQVDSNLKTNNNIASQRQLLLKHLFDSPLTPSEVAQLPPDQQHLVGTGDKDAIELQVRILNDQLQGRANTLDQSVKYLTDAYSQDVKDTEDKKQQAIDTVQKFAATYGSNAGAALKSLYGDQYIQQLKDMGIDINAFSQLSPQTVSEEKANPSDSSSVAVTIPSGTIASQTNNPLNIKFIAGNELGGTDSGITAKDGGTFAAFQSPEAGLDAATKLLQSPTYANLTIDQAMKKWSNNGYGAEVSASLNANQKISSLSDDQLTQLVSDMAKRESGATVGAANDPTVDAWVDQIANGNSTLTNVPAALRSKVALALNDTPTTTYSPLAGSRFATDASKIEKNFLDLPQYQLTANGLPYLQRIDAAMKTPGSISDQDLLDSLTKLNTAGNAISDAQVKVITDGQSFSDWTNVLSNKFKNGGVLSDTQRQQIQKIAQSIYANYAKGYQPVYDQVTKQLSDAGIPKPFWSIPDLNDLAAKGGLTDGTNDAPSQFDSLFNQYGGK